MIDSVLKVEFLKPEIWTNLGTVIAPLFDQGRILHILQRGDGQFKGVTSEHKTIPMEQFISGNGVNLHSIFEKYSDIIEVRVYTMPGLVSYYKEIQESPVYNEDIDDYLVRLYHVQENTEGIQIYKRNSGDHRCYLERLKSLVGSETGKAVVFIWLTDKDTLFFNCILEFESGRLKGLSTSDRYPKADEKYEAILSLIKKEYNCRVIPVKMELADYIGKIKGV